MKRERVDVPGLVRVASAIVGEVGRGRFQVMRIAGGSDEPVELRPLTGPVVDALLPILSKTLRIRPDELLANPDTRILENRDDPDEETLGASSLQSLRAKNAVEERFGFKVPESELRAYRSLRTIVDRVEEEQARVNGQPSPDGAPTSS